MLYRSPIRLSWIFMLLYYKLHCMFCGMGDKKSKEGDKNIFLSFELGWKYFQGNQGTYYRGKEVFQWREKKRKKKFSDAALSLQKCVPTRRAATVHSSLLFFLSFSVSSTEDRRLLWTFSWVISHMCSHMSIQFRNCIYLWIAYLELYGFLLFHSLWVSPRTWALQ